MYYKKTENDHCFIEMQLIGDKIKIAFKDKDEKITITPIIPIDEIDKLETLHKQIVKNKYGDILKMDKIQRTVKHDEDWTETQIDAVNVYGLGNLDFEESEDGEPPIVGRLYVHTMKAMICLEIDYYMYKDFSEMIEELKVNIQKEKEQQDNIDNNRVPFFMQKQNGNVVLD